ncbi:MAG: hypothetical protein A4E57_00760 [Syntrophorhabdaceae bacterium PtaU1.Bin034]|nr:MAG: hypothetical protein A4E57_00760 [Syntrophorhabdaceae bacterium PtaU1.Bin034]
MADRVFRLLIIEDDRARIEQITSWLPPGMKTVVAPSAGTALGILQRDRGTVYSGIMLDHDLQGRARTEQDKTLSGSDLIDVIIRNVSVDVPILIHSMNPAGASVMVERLEGAGFSVERIPMLSLTKDLLSNWLDEVRSVWED